LPLQTTLLTLAIAFILALVAALVGPLVIDWSSYRPLVEREASRIIGTEVHVRGDIDARLLPSPRLSLHGIEIGPPGDDALKAQALTVEFGLGPLMRGEWRASDMQIVGPQVRLTLDTAGHVKIAAKAPSFDADALSIDRLSIENGTILLSDEANGASVMLEKVWFLGDLRSMLGPIKGEGAATIAGEMVPFRLSTGRADPDGGLKLRLNLDPTNTPLNVEADGVLTVSADTPRFEGSVNFARPVGIAKRSSDALITQPWHVRTKIKATPASALMESIDFQYGSDQQGVKLSGTAEFRFGARPSFNGVLSARQIDLDRIAGESGAPRTPPAATIRRLAGLAASAFRPPIPIQIGLGIDQVTLGGAPIQNLRGDISTSANGWTLDRFEFRAPGLTQVQVSGRLAVDADGVSFTGPAEVSASDPRALTAWLEGREPTSGLSRPLRVRGDLTLGSEKVAIDRLNAVFDRETVTGRFAYVFAAKGQGARLDAVLNAPTLDIDAAQNFVKAVVAGSSAERPSEVTLALDIGRATMAGIDAKKLNARLRYEKDGLQIEKLSIDDLGGASLSASGQISTVPVARGNIRVDLEASDMTGLTALAARYAPKAGEPLARIAPALAPAKLTGTFALDGGSPVSGATFTLKGSAGVMRVDFTGEAKADLGALNESTLRLQGRIDARDASALASLFGVDKVATIGKEPGAFVLSASGPVFGRLQVVSHLETGGFKLSGSGTASVIGPNAPSAQLSINLAHADLAPLLAVQGHTAHLPVALASRLSIDGDEMTFDDLTAVIAGTKLRGQVTLTSGEPYRLTGTLNADDIDLGGLIAASTGMPAGISFDRAWRWPTEPFDGDALKGLDGQVSLKALRARLGPYLDLRQFATDLQFGGGGIAFDKMSAALAGGSINGSVALQPGDGGLALRTTLDIAGADVTALYPGGARPPVTGQLTLHASLEGKGLSPAAMVGSLRGNGTIALGGGQLAGLDPRAFDVITRAVDSGLPIDAAKVGDLARRTLDSGQLPVKSASGEFSVAAGQLRLGTMAVKGEGADASMSGSFDLTRGDLDLRVVLSGMTEAAGARPDIFLALNGPLSSPARSIDASALAGWLTMRSIERQTRKIEAIENAPAPAAPAVKPQPDKPQSKEISPTGTPAKDASPPAANPASPPAVKPPPAARREQAPPLPAPIMVEPAPKPANPVAKPAAKPAAPRAQQPRQSGGQGSGQHTGSTGGPVHAPLSLSPGN
jgi:large subunit ribosomal protein L24